MTVLKLPRLPTGWQNNPQLFERYWNLVMTQIESNINDILQIPVIAASASDAATAAASANAAAATATAAAATANAAATQSQRTASLTTSGVTGCTISASDAGSNCTASISGHTRVYGDGTSVSVTGGSVTGLAYSTLYYFYYDQPSRLGGTVTYLSTTSNSVAAQVNDRHLVGSVTTPAALGVPNIGKYVAVSGIGNLL